MTGLFDLPAELLFLIFDQLDYFDFNRYPGLLTVCRAWLPYAQYRVCQSLFLGTKALTRDLTGTFLGMGIAYTRALKLCLYIEKDAWKRGPASECGTKRGRKEDPISPLSCRERHSLRAESIRKLNAGLSKLGALLKGSTTLQELTITNEPEDWEWPHTHTGIRMSPRHFLSHASLTDLPNQRGLRDLSLDLNSCATPRASCTADPDADPMHLCPVLTALLPTLEILGIRVPYLCFDALEPPMGQEINPAITHILIELPLAGPHPPFKASKEICTRLCGSALEDSHRLERALQKRLREIALASPQAKRMLVCYGVPNREMCFNRPRYPGWVEEVTEHRQYDARTDTYLVRERTESWEKGSDGSDVRYMEYRTPWAGEAAAGEDWISDTSSEAGSDRNYSSCSEAGLVVVSADTDDADSDSSADSSLEEEKIDQPRDDRDIYPDLQEQDLALPVEEVVRDMRENPPSDAETWDEERHRVKCARLRR